MDTDAVLLKTPRGREEIRTRAHGLPPIARRLLIIADGRRTVAELAAALDREATDAELRDAFGQLLDGQYLHVSDARAAGGHSAPEAGAMHAPA